MDAFKFKDCRFCRELDEGIEACCEIMYEPDDSSLCRMMKLNGLKDAIGNVLDIW